jgi:hypothetical protein
MGNWFARKLISSEELLGIIVEAEEVDEMDIDFDEKREVRARATSRARSESKKSLLWFYWS